MVLEKYLKEANISYDESFLNRCETFTSLLQQWGKVHNLTGQLRKEQIYENIIDSIYPISLIKDIKSIADIGTGAGYPGLILAFYLKDAKVYLIEPRVKRVAFLNFVKASLDLDNVVILQKRVEDIKDIKVDMITSRAVSNISLLLELSKSIKKQTSSYLLYKGSLLEDEIKQADIKDYEIVEKKDRKYLYIKD